MKTWVIMMMLAISWSPVYSQSWESSCGAVSLVVASRLAGRRAGLAEIRTDLKPNEEGKTTMTNLRDAAQRLGLHASGVQIRSELIERCTVPLIAHFPPNHFAVVLGLGAGKGVAVINPPHAWRTLSTEELRARPKWNVLAVSSGDIDVGEEALVGNTPTTASEAEVPLVWEPEVWNCGFLRPHTQAQGRIRLCNKGKTRLSVSGIRTDCSCLHARCDVRSVEPGGTADIAVTLDANGVVGAFQKQVIITYTEEGSSRSRLVSIPAIGEVSVRGLLSSVPTHNYVNRAIVGERTMASVRIERAGMPLGDVSVSSTCNEMTARFTPVSKTEAIVDMELSPRAAGKFEYELLVSAKDDAGTVEYRHLVHGNAVSPVDVTPAKLWLGAGDLSGREWEIRIADLRGKAITDVVANADGFETEAIREDGEGASWRVVFRMSKVPTAGVVSTDAKLVIRSSTATECVVPLMGIMASSKNQTVGSPNPHLQSVAANELEESARRK